MVSILTISTGILEAGCIHTALGIPLKYASGRKLDADLAGYYAFVLLCVFGRNITLGKYPSSRLSMV